MERGDIHQPSVENQGEKADSAKVGDGSKKKGKVTHHCVGVLLPETALNEEAVEKIAKDFCPQSNKFLLIKIMGDAEGVTETPHYKLLDDLHSGERFAYEMRKLFEKNGFESLRGLPVVVGDPQKELQFLVQNHGIQYMICFQEKVPSDLLQKTGLNRKPGAGKQPCMVRTYPLA